MTKAEVEQVLGPPSHLVNPGELEILAYRPEQIGDAIYSIRAAFQNGLVAHCYLAFELCEAKPERPLSRSARYFQLFLVVLLGALAALIYAWFATR